MLELFHGSLGEQLPIYPDSGPGNKALLFGNEQLGYFGEVTESELFSRQTLAKLTGFYPVTPNTAATGKIWLKFFFNNKIIYIAKMPLGNGVTWNDVYNAGLVYGTNDNGKYPSSTPTNQFNLVSKKEGERIWTLIPRLPTGVDTDPAPYNATLGIAMTYTQASEMTALMSRVWDGLTGSITEKWARFSNADLTLSNQWATLIQETMSNNSANVGIVGNADTPYYRAIIPKGSAAHYRPVLELIDAAQKAIAPGSILVDSTGLADQIFMLDVRDYSEAVGLNLGVKMVHVVNQVSKDIDVTYSIDPSTVLAAKPLITNESSDWMSFTISGEYI